MQKYIEKKEKKYVMASPDYGSYLQKVGFGSNPRYKFTTDIVVATKTNTKNDAKYLIHCYQDDTGDDLDLVVIPVEVTYELINEVYDGVYDEEKIINEEVSSWNLN